MSLLSPRAGEVTPSCSSLYEAERTVASQWSVMTSVLVTKTVATFLLIFNQQPYSEHHHECGRQEYFYFFMHFCVQSKQKTLYYHALDEHTLVKFS